MSAKIYYAHLKLAVLTFVGTAELPWIRIAIRYFFVQSEIILFFIYLLDMLALVAADTG